MIPVLLAVCLISGSADAAPRVAERGMPVIDVHTTDDYRGGTQNFSITQGSRDILYVGNLWGLLIWDGEWWRLIEGGTARYAVAANSRGTIAWGGVNELGLLVSDDKGRLAELSLVDELGDSSIRFGDVHQIVPFGPGFLFRTDAALLHWTGREMESLLDLEPGQQASELFPLDGADVLIRVSNELYRLDSEGLRVTEIPLIDPAEIEGLVPRTDGWLIYSSERGLLEWREGSLSALSPEGSAWIRQHRLSAMIPLPDGRWAFGSRRGGILILLADGTVDQIIDYDAGLPNQHVKALFVDRRGFLWAGLNNGLARLDVSTPLSVLDARSGLQGGAVRVARFDGRLMVASGSGVYLHEPASDDQDGGQFVPLAEPDTASWDLESVEEGVIVGTSDGIGIVQRDLSWQPVAGTEKVTAYELVRSVSDPDRIWVGTRRGLGFLERSGGVWRWAGEIEGSPPYVRSIVELDQDHVIAGTIFDGLNRVDLRQEPPSIVTMGGGEIGVFRGPDGIYVSHTEQGIGTYDPEKGTISFDPLLSSIAENQSVFALAFDDESNLWMNSLPPTVAIRKADGSFENDPIRLTEVSARDIQMIMPEDQVVWIGGERGLFRWGGPIGQRVRRARSPMLRKVSQGDDVIYGGSGEFPPTSIPHGSGRLRFEVAAGIDHPDSLYQFRLDPLEQDWSEPSSEPFVEFTSLWESDYRLHARVVTRAGGAGPAAVWSFEVTPPWFRTPVAYALWIAAFAVLLWVIARTRDRQHRARARELQEQVESRTAALSEAVGALEVARDEVMQKNQLLEEANIRLEEMTRHDPLTGVGNRRHLESVLDEEWRRSFRADMELAFVILDLDRFKALNDSRGHREGDRALQRIGNLLSEQVKRGGDFVARYGGEEFAILLPDTDLEGGRIFAESLRQKIADLAIPVRPADGSVVTASFGVASRRPRDRGLPEDLIEAADRALYLAKTRGRNRVETEE